MDGCEPGRTAANDYGQQKFVKIGATEQCRGCRRGMDRAAVALGGKQRVAFVGVVRTQPTGVEPDVPGRWWPIQASEGKGQANIWSLVGRLQHLQYPGTQL